MAEKCLNITVEERKELNKILLNKNRVEIEYCLKSLKDWITKQYHLPQNEDEYILRILLALNKFSVEKTKNKLEVMYSGKQFLPEFFENYSPTAKRLQHTLNKYTFLPIPNLTSGSLQRVVLSKFLNKDVNDLDPIELVRLIILTTELRLKNDFCAGDAVIIDMEYASFSLIAKCSPRIIQNAFNYLAGSFTDRIKSMNFINVPSYAHSIITVLKSLLKNKIVDRVYVHKDLNSLHQIVPKNCLPEELGGSLPTIKKLADDWRKFLESQESWFLERSKMKSNEKFRVGEPFNSELFGMQGSFQHLVID